MSLGDVGKVRRTLPINLDGEFGQHWRGKSRKGGKMKPGAKLHCRLSQPAKKMIGSTIWRRKMERIL